MVFFEILDEITPLLDPKPNCPIYMFLSAEKKLAVTLYYLKDTFSLWIAGNTFRIHQCTVSKTIVQVCQAIDAILGPDLPRSEFEWKFGMAQASGCIDGIHIHIKRPIENSQNYNYKQFFSLNVQAVCDSRGRFIDVECKWPGSVHDAKVFANLANSKNLRDYTSFYLQYPFTRTKSYSKLFNWWPSIFLNSLFYERIPELF